MAGLMQRRMAGAGGMREMPEQRGSMMNGMPAGRGPMRQDGASEMEQEGQRRPATPEEQRLHDDFIGNALKVVYEPKTADHIVELLRGGEGNYPVESLAKVTAMVISTVKASAEQAGNQIPDEIVVRAAAKVTFDIGTALAPAAKLPEFNEQQIQGAFFRAMEMLREGREQGMPRQQGRSMESRAPSRIAPPGVFEQKPPAGMSGPLMNLPGTVR